MKTKFVLIRHGEPRYDEVNNDTGLAGGGYDFGRLTDKGREQASLVAENPCLVGSEIIIASPYTRALETAATISRKLNLPLIVEHNLHEWSPDKNGEIINIKEIDEEFYPAKGIKNETHKYNWETYQEMKDRLFSVLNRYTSYKKVIVVCHGLIMTTLTFFGDRIEHCGIRETEIES